MCCQIMNDAKAMNLQHLGRLASIALAPCETNVCRKGAGRKLPDAGGSHRAALEIGMKRLGAPLPQGLDSLIDCRWRFVQLGMRV
jgi:hypothetical protein